MTSKQRGMWLLCLGLVPIGLGCSMETGAGTEDLGESQMAIGGFGGSSMGSAGSTFVELTIARDAQISSTSPATNFGLTTSCGVAGGEVAKSCLIKWDLNSIPTNAVIDSAYVKLDIFDASVSSFDILQVNASWQELEVNWTQRDLVNNWSSPGCNSVQSDRMSVRAASFVGNAGLRYITLNGVGRSMIQSWVANPATNKGIIIRNNTGTLDGLAIRSAQYSDASHRPVIGFSYHLP
jgi:hypothetical protein